MPIQHGLIGRHRARRIVPRGLDGVPDPAGRMVLLSVGMSNASQEWCSQTATDGVSCTPWSFAGQARADSTRRPELVIFNGALAGQVASSWTDSADPSYDRIDTLLQDNGLSPLQVQAVWVKSADRQPTSSLPAAGADAFLLEEELGQTVRALKARYPNLQQVFLTSRIYGGYAVNRLNPEPFAYESGYAVKWLIEAQINQEASHLPDPLAGDLGPAIAPWVGWGPYLWADGPAPRSDGLSWQPVDFETDGVHPSRRGEHKVGTALLRFFQTSPQTACWYLRGGVC
jgi:hypothetical protein